MARGQCVAKSYPEVCCLKCSVCNCARPGKYGKIFEIEPRNVLFWLAGVIPHSLYLSGNASHSKITSWLKDANYEQEEDRAKGGVYELKANELAQA